MAQAFFNRDKSEFPPIDRTYEAISAGTRHSEQINPFVLQAMGEIGIDMGDTEIYFPKGLVSDYVRSRGRDIQRVIVVCDDKGNLPPEIDRDLKIEYWDLPDPHEQSLNQVREVRDLTWPRVMNLLEVLI